MEAKDKRFGRRAWLRLRPDVRKAYAESWVTHANKDRTAEKNQLRSLVSTVTLLAEAHNEVLDPNDPAQVVLQTNKGQMTVPGFQPVRSRKRKTARSENVLDASISKETMPKLLSAKEMMRSGMFNALAEPTEATSANSEEEGGDEVEIDVDEEGGSRRQSSLYNALGKETSAPYNTTARKKGHTGGAKPPPKGKKDKRNRPPKALIAAGKMSDKDRDEDVQINDEQAIKIIRDRTIRKMLRNASEPNHFTKKGELYANVRTLLMGTARCEGIGRCRP
ncbi:hypothetical protein LTR97_000874 [Elasticomyces elasticus]|uniref:Uncharacterized protein n=1 Tax=Elasticomyces elasticus TaxID=574655 RepID=A0AAN7ZWL1_9PEZI|nr:hypothetical protein LTR97_000874 [Elasticomyces elasticus]